MLVGNRVAVGLKLDKPVEIADPQGHLGTIIGMEGQRVKCGKLLFEKECQRSVAGGAMHMDIASFTHPPAGNGLQIIKVLKLPTSQQIIFYILKWSLDFTFGLRPATLANNRLTAVKGDEGRKRWIDHRSPCLPAQYHSFFAVIKSLSWCTSEMGEGVMVSSDQGEKIPSLSKIDKMPSGEAQDKGKALHRGFAGLGKIDGVRAPVHLPLNAGRGLKTNNRRFPWGGTQAPPQQIPEDADAARIPGSAEFFKEPLSGNLGIFFQNIFDSIFKGIKFTGPERGRAVRFNKVVALIPLLLSFPQDVSDRVLRPMAKCRLRPDCRPVRNRLNPSSSAWLPGSIRQTTTGVCCPYFCMDFSIARSACGSTIRNEANCSLILSMGWVAVSS